MTIELLTAALLALPNTSFREAPERAPIVASAIRDAAQGDQRVAVLLVAVGFYESRFLDRIQAGACKPHECDPIHVRGELRFQSRSYWQLQRRAAASGDEWRSTSGLAPENVTAAAGVAGRRLRRGLAACRTYEGAVAYYAFGACRWEGAAKRARLARDVERRLAAAGSGGV